ncbi:MULTISPECIES: hypothetical protein [Pseudomonas]|uniref:hypothetical protein n=1 Tax=Pseudomonas TaxID=286 RepID=UPI000CF65122|nr:MULTISPECIES: hypothetical protein [Pseudomonas]AVJ40189.1 hypothetical protein CLM75_23685 [Pseudomonas lurida]MBC8980732.1 hypothetical protein [Pseudomonas lurida]PRA14341.1 hypothetical protein CQ002_21810 [Pseudomonas sp. MYb13]PRA18122.1 hypothetical protein CQ004_23640 [Pseudomonas lurida]PRA31024.1 hypothetical protein CQ005_21875 [Pseudomonas lurida]
MKAFLLIPALFSLAVSAAEIPTPPGPNPMQFTGRFFTFAADDPLGQIKSPAKIGYTALVLDKQITVRTDIGNFVSADRVQFALDDGDSLPNGVRVKLECGFVMGAETRHHFEPLFCGQSKWTVLR